MAFWGRRGGIRKLELRIFSEHLGHEAWDLCRTLIGRGGLEVGDVVSWSTAFNHCHKKEQLKCPGGLPGAALPESLCQASLHSPFQTCLASDSGMFLNWMGSGQPLHFRNCSS